MAKMRRDHINRNDYALFVVPVPKPEPGFHSTYLVVFIGVFNDLRWEIFVSSVKSCTTAVHNDQS